MDRAMFENVFGKQIVKTFIEVKETIWNNSFCRVFMTIGLIAFACCLLYELGKTTGSLLATII